MTNAEALNQRERGNRPDPNFTPVFYETLGKIAEKSAIVITGIEHETVQTLEESPYHKWYLPRTLKLKDYDVEELRQILIRLIAKHSMKVANDFLPRIVARRVAAGRDTAAFGNVHDLQAAFSKILERHSLRLRDEGLLSTKAESETETETAGDGPKEVKDVSLLTKEDMIGPEPKDVEVQPLG